MRLDKQYISIGDLKAETWLNSFFPENYLFEVKAKGTFYSNYCEDLLEVDTGLPEGNKLCLSRDGLFHLLPEALFVEENRLRDPKLKQEPFAAEKEHILNFFIPFDTEFFQISRELDKTVCGIESGVVDILLKLLYNIDPKDVHNPFIKKVLPLLLQVSEIRGDFVLITQLISAITGFDTEIQPAKTSVTFPFGRKEEYIIINIVFSISGLTNFEYNQLYDDLKEFVDFISEWFFPADLPIQYVIKDNNHPFTLDGTLTLDYNTHF